MEALPYKKWIDGVGLDSSEKGNPPSKFHKVFFKAIEEGFLTVAHAGEEGPPEYIWEAIKLLNVTRIDHGNACINDEDLLEYLSEKQIPLTLCPLSNLELKVISELKDFPILEMMKKGLLVTINSDDPAYFGGYMNENFIGIANALDLSHSQLSILAKNGFKGSWLSEEDKEKAYLEIDNLLI